MTSSDVVIVGAGLSGLTAAFILSEAGQSVRVLEAGAVAGGRIKSVVSDDGTFIADLGPTWVWPSVQPTITRWFERLDLEQVPQFDRGNAVFDSGPGHAPQIGFMPGQAGSARVRGGSHAIVTALLQRLPEHTVQTNRIVQRISLSNDCVMVGCKGNETRPFTSGKLIVALPPRIAASTIRWEPDLPADLKADMRGTPTWMAPHAKAVAFYEKAFWREQGLSGRIASQSGPIVEAHDHSGPDGTPAAIFGFIGWPHNMRAHHHRELREQVALQLMRCFGENSSRPTAIHIEDWAENPLIASPDDLAGSMLHPSVRPDSLRASCFDNRIVFAGAETAEISPGLIEGAFDSGARAANLILGRDQ